MSKPSNFTRITHLLRNPQRGMNWISRLAKRALGKDFTNRGERVDIVYDDSVNFDKLDVYQKSHFRRYQFACAMLSRDAVVGDMACGTGYGTVMMSAAARHAHGYDISPIISVVRKRYAKINNVSFTQGDILEIEHKERFDVIVSFETLEHFPPTLIPQLFKKFHSMLFEHGRLIISTPYNQEETEASRVHHRTFYITEQMLNHWVVASGFKLDRLLYQNYETHEIREVLTNKDFMVAICSK